jgi:hypothetical protein
MERIKVDVHADASGNIAEPVRTYLSTYTEQLKEWNKDRTQPVVTGSGRITLDMGNIASDSIHTAIQYRDGHVERITAPLNIQEQLGEGNFVNVHTYYNALFDDIDNIDVPDYVKLLPAYKKYRDSVST